jgi:hypothetical protein
MIQFTFARFKIFTVQIPDANSAFLQSPLAASLHPQALHAGESSPPDDTETSSVIGSFIARVKP